MRASPHSRPNFDIAQHGGDVILAEPQKASGIDQSTMGTADATATTSTMRTLVGGRTAAIIDADRGEVWVGRPMASRTSPPPQPPRRSTRHRRPNRHRRGRHRLRPRRPHGKGVHRRGWFNTAHEIVTLNEGEPIAADSFTVVDGQPVASSGNRLYFGRSHITVDGVGTLTLQAPPADTDDRSQRGWVAAAAPGALVTMPLNEGETRHPPHRRHRRGRTTRIGEADACTGHGVKPRETMPPSARRTANPICSICRRSPRRPIFAFV